MKYLFQVTCLLIVLLKYTIVHGQDFGEEFVKYKTPNILPPSPNPASIGKFGNIPVNLYTGLVNISIPISEIKVQDFSLPITVDYHSGGVRVEEIASSVGQGWSLMCGGVITRIVRGKQDELPLNYMDEEAGVAARVERFVNDQMPEAEKLDFLIDASNGNLDTEPDIFQISLPGIISEKFVYCPGKGFMVIPNKKLKIEGSPSAGFVITTTSGHKFYFQEKESTQVIGRGSKSGTGPFGYLDPVNYNSSWHLNKIDLNNGNIITLEYTSSTIKPTYNSTLSHYVRVGPSPPDCFGNPVFENDYYINTYNTTTIIQKKVSKISWPSGYLMFNYEPAQRSDLPGDYALKDIVTCNSAVIRKTKFTYSYHSNRLFLTRVTALSADSINNGEYIVTYSNADNLPARDSHAQDHWGFYNGAEGNSSIMENREPNGERTLYGMIKRITYPTGGYTDFEFEPNTYGNIEGDKEVLDTIRDVVDSSIHALSTGDPSTITTSLFYIPFKQSVYVTANVKGSNTYTKILKASGEAVFDFRGTNSELKTVNQYVELDTGYHYVKVFNYEAEFRADIIFSFKKYTGNFTINRNRIAGGARVKRVTDYDYATGTSNIREFNYQRENDTAKSSGILNNIPRYTYRKINSLLRSCESAGGGTILTNIVAAYEVQQSQSALAIIYTSGSHIGYNTVTVSQGIDGRGGRTVSHFTHYGQFPDTTFDSYPLTNSISRDHRRGMLVSQADYLGGVVDSGVVRKTDKAYFYKNDSSVLIPGANIGFYIEHKADPTLSTFVYQKYSHFGEFASIARTRDTIYDKNRILVQESDFYYENPLNLMNTRIVNRDSKGNARIIVKKYAHDFKTTMPVWDTMINRNMIDKVVEQVESTNALELKRQKIEYGISQPGNIVMPSQVRSKILNYPEQIDVKFMKYDSRGNPIEVISRDGIITTYLWGYNSQYPVAKVVGSDFATVSQYYSQNILDNVATTDAQMRMEIDSVRQRLPQALVTSNTYSPVVGITSETDPNGRTTYYEYDSFGRLKLVKDMNGKILKQYDYQYQKPITQ